MRGIANLVTASRLVASAVMLALPAASAPFWTLYAWCGLSDMADGPLARRLGEESELGARLDSASDLAFVLACFVTLAPVLRFEAWLVAWVAAIAVCKVAAYVSGLVMHGRLIALHTAANKAAGLLLFATVPLMAALDSALPAIPACALATFAAVQEGHWVRSGRLQ
ncbi:MAG: CDP-alcohol phosphatidyltransferase family protein [Coriobacteriales bacterium]